ncbi:MAG: coat protein [Cressdnaviricota sp.]|nr:MAG: coat protein [Cressdnaviricota sp.]
MAGGRLAAQPKRRVVKDARAKAPARRAGPAAAKPRKQKSESGNMFRSGGAGLGTILGTALGGPAGGALGGIIGKGAGSVLSKIFGHGDYDISNVGHIKQNALINASQAPAFGSGRVAVNLKHREFLGDVISSATAGQFTIKDYAINPGLVATFPWMSDVVGASFQQYRINGMTFEFRSMSSDALNSTNTALGSVVMCTDYDSKDVPFTSKQQMENTEFGVSCKPSQNMMHAIECQRNMTAVSELYIRAYAVPSGADIRLYDLGRFSVATVGCQGTSVNLGELWVSYDVDVFKAIEQVPYYLCPFAQYAITGATASAPLGTAQAVPAGVTNSADQIGLTFTSANRVTWPSDIQVGTTYKVLLGYIGAAAAAFTAPVVTCGNGFWMNSYDDWVGPAPTAVVSNTGFIQVVLRYKGGGTPAAPPFLNIANFTWAPAGGISETDLLVSAISGNYGGAYDIQTA